MMWTSPYFIFRVSSGFALVLAGLSYLFEKSHKKERRSFGWTLFAAGTLFVISALDSRIKLQLDLSNCFVAFWLYVLGRNFTDTALFILEDGQKPLSERFRRVSDSIGIVWTVIVCALPLLDYVFHLAPVVVSIEDSNSLGPFHLAASLAAYGLPLQSCLFAIAGGYLRLVRPGPDSPDARTMLLFFVILLADILVISVSLFLSLTVPYRLAFTLLQILLITMHFYVVAHPECLEQARREVRNARNCSRIMAKNEEEKIRQALAELENDDLLCDADCSLAQIAKRLGIPGYRLSAFFCECLDTSYPVWINRIRINKACKLLLTDDDSSVLDIAFSCGYGSKSAFSEQFKKLTGLSPRDYKKARQGEQFPGKSA